MEKVIKRDKKQVPFDENKIKIVLRKANGEVAKKHRISEQEISDIADFIKNIDKKCLGVEAIQDIIVNKLVELNKSELVSQYIQYRYLHKLRREANTTDDAIFELLGGTSEYWNKENSNKNAKVVTTQRDYIAGVTSVDISRRILLPKDIVQAHDEGLIHVHDLDYFAQNALTNCCLINLEDMLQNGTMINGVRIDKPHKLSTAATIATQIIAAVASSQYGGCTISLSHLAPFVRDSYLFYINEGLSLFKNKINTNDILIDSIKKYGIKYITTAKIPKKYKKAINYANLKIKQEINAAVQTFNYQVNSMSTTNGQAPFISVNMYLGEDPNYTQEIAMLIEEFLLQRIKGMKNKNGNYVAQTFPKLLYVLEEQNINDNSEYYYLTRLAAECTTKRMVPDYISEKIIVANKFGIDNKTGLVIPGYEHIFKANMLNLGYSEIEIDEEIVKELEMQKGGNS